MTSIKNLLLQTDLNQTIIALNHTSMLQSLSLQPYAGLLGTWLTLTVHHLMLNIQVFQSFHLLKRQASSVTLDCHLTMNAHVSNIARTCYFELRRLASIRRFLTSTATATLVSAFVLSRIDYCSSLLLGSTNDVTSHLQRIDNYAARVILRLPMSSSITIHLKSLHWLPVKVRSTYKIACLCYHSSTAPSYVTDMLHKKPLHTRNTRSS